MPPRRRTKKKSNTRKDAAIDAMKPYGFPVDVVQTTIKDLLHVYGENGWPFIEDSAYKVLLEAILEKVTGEGTSDSKEPVAETSSRTALVPVCSDVSPLNAEFQTSNGFDGAPELNKTLCISKLTNESGNYLLPVEAEGCSKRDVTYPCGNNHSTPLHGHNSPPLQGDTLTTKRRPYYGWIGSDDEEDIMELTPGPIAEEMENFLKSFVVHKKRWDIKPDDM
ncbi:hypothetical protein E1A91_D10G290400v1 [Gossypium mustelinum]|uniref:WIYLD domain-containing protein n=1 Tax=Gossypium mustelinum TaxID=34275 RepID=A0A5D2TCK6_GOSMU|nr:hypothetical protein E1A91_D10G290400v1 [Gossypium mustelinum]